MQKMTSASKMCPQCIESGEIAMVNYSNRKRLFSVKFTLNVINNATMAKTKGLHIATHLI